VVGVEFVRRIFRRQLQIAEAAVDQLERGAGLQRVEHLPLRIFVRSRRQIAGEPKADLAFHILARRQRARHAGRAGEDAACGQRPIDHFRAGLGGDLGADDRLADKLVDRIHHRAGIGEAFRLEMLRQCVEALAGPPRAHECLCEFVDCGLVHGPVPTFVMPALVAATHVFLASKQDVDGRDKPSHDE